MAEKPVLLYHEDFKLHDPSPYYHPENPRRLAIALEGLRRYKLMERLELREPGKGDPRVFREVHSSSYVDMIISTGVNHVEWLDPDTYVSPGTYPALERLAGAAVEAAELAISGRTVLILPRPPGHHAGRSGRGLGAPTLGFCLLNTVALIVSRIEVKGLKVAVIDFDVHHGNGTQDIFYSEGPLHIDMHQDSATIYPGTGFPSQVGEDKARGLMVNINLPPGAGDDIGLDAVRKALGFMEDYDPDIVVVSAGFDGYRGDNPMASLELGSAYYHTIGSGLAGLDLLSVVVVLEGGYGSGLSEALPAFIYGLLSLEDPVADERKSSSNHAWAWYRRRLRELEEALGQSI
ncbi:MAG: histone deacetylase family protein [Desulfurococcales archaeon]|nr:histone deacetylase family protein [Desulfurococcales archaeon]